jgi:hypothetical protein
MGCMNDNKPSGLLDIFLLEGRTHLGTLTLLLTQCLGLAEA